MNSIRKKILISILICSIFGLGVSFILINLNVNNSFNDYMEEMQNKRDKRIIEYFSQVYKRDGSWTEESGEELIHEAYMNSYCLSLMNIDKKIIWMMNPDTIRQKGHMMDMMQNKNKGIYTSKTYEIKVEEKIVGYVAIGQYSSILLSKEDEKFINSLNNSVLISILFTIIITVIISLYISKQISNPIKKVSDISVALSKGNYDIGIESKSNILEIKKLEDSISELKEKLQKQDSLRKRLVSDISHEIRTPLNILQNNLEAMIDGIFPLDEENLVGLNEEVIRFGKLLDNLNILKEIEGEDINLSMHKVSLKNILEGVIKDFSIILKEKHIQLEKHIDKDKNYYINGDENALKQVLINIISNSVKFIKSNGIIKVILKENKNNIEIIIEDNGEGIKREDLPFIFERLYRGDKSRHEIDGSGIGLTIVKRILNIHSAYIDIESELGKGTIVQIKFKKY
ncbi:sensor histidine kinase [Clostridium cochlearium]|uniref:sensor histidine kinase n=1 Tax=Clostridium cochlearium TaxID=1494 RepID=UPI000B947C15|nr:HAMP domain-containing sensor histidine kinase [Clostridium cochlearium]MBV1821038.1 HAMP domain-containing histidine kinase [Bacteroidales bacterium MSK.15.36]NSJ92348.1 HAMP domain-containing histidine kinase [Coprococcus sp. MSK.21.13]MCG4571216.1 HAMP domain-containing histidine kinase [Clostridium cochlearium]MCG4578745.1 HAMP domain-containing histidine kinase [Clostridium cochlearium]MDU1442975.1 HAMP domain-containing sensor histidine kinase [Clostridium cochlearium]